MKKKEAKWGEKGAAASRVVSSAVDRDCGDNSMPLVGRGEVRVRRGRVSSSECLCWETVWIEGQVDMPFQICGRHDRGGIRKFVYDADGPAFQEVGGIRCG